MFDVIYVPKSDFIYATATITSTTTIIIIIII